MTGGIYRVCTPGIWYRRNRAYDWRK
ncbi:hypothetical protein [Blautia sp.]